MHSGYTGHIVPAEWRWVILVGTLLVLTAFAPFIWITLSGASGASWQFMGVLHDYPNGATYLSKMLQSNRGLWLVNFYHTPEPHNAMFMQEIYLLLGHTARLISVSPIIMFHVARVGASLIMYMAIYQLAAVIWMRVRTRRLFFIIAALGAGFGWLFGALSGDTTYPDLVVPDMFPLQSTLVNVHFPLAMAFSALLVSIIVGVFRLDAQQDPSMENGGLVAALLSFLLSFIYPEPLVLIGVVLAVYVAVFCYKQRQLQMWAVRWLGVVVLPALPVVFLYGVFATYNPAMSEWYRQKITYAPNFLMLLLSLGIPLLLALPGIYRAVRRFEPDGDQFMLMWLVAMLVAMYLPTNFQYRFAFGMMLPLAYFAARSLEDFWFQRFSGRWRLRFFLTLVPLMSVSHLLVIFAPVLPIFKGDFAATSGMFLQRDYTSAFQWLDEQTSSLDVVLASPNVSLWLPVWARARVVYGHPFETLDAAVKRAAVLAWYQSDAGENCDPLLRGAYRFERPYTVRYVIVGPQERQLGAAQCSMGLTFIASFGSVNIYQVER